MNHDDTIEDAEYRDRNLELVTRIAALVGGWLAAAVLVVENDPYSGFDPVAADLDTAGVVGFLLDTFGDNDAHGGLTRGQWIAEVLRHAPATREALERTMRERVQ